MPRSLRYMAGFECAGSACEDTCCANWRIDVDRAHLVKIARVLERTAEGRAELARAFQFPDEADRTETKYASMRLGDDASCPFLDGERLCSLQRRFGPRLLPDVCAHYPRSISELGGELELAGQLSCPEVVRRCLLADDACDLVEVPPDKLARGGLRQRHYDWVPYMAPVPHVRATLFHLLDAPQYPVASRLFFAACFAARTADFFYQDVPTLDVERLQAERGLIADAGVWASLEAELRAAEVPDGLALYVIAQVLSSETRHRSATAFRRVLDAVLGAYASPAGGSLSAAELWAAYTARRQAHAQLVPRIDGYVRNYAKHYFAREWYIDSPNLLAHVQSLLARVAVLRFLILGHPGLDGAPDDDSGARCDRVAVEVVYSFSRGLEHHDEFLKLITTGLQAQLPTLAHSAALCRV